MSSGDQSVFDQTDSQILKESLLADNRNLKASSQMLEEITGERFSRKILGRFAKDLGFQFMAPDVKREVTIAHVEERRRYCKDIVSLPPENIVGGDESFFTLDWHHTPKRWVLVDEAPEVEVGNTRSGLHVFAAISKRGRTELSSFQVKKLGTK